MTEEYTHPTNYPYLPPDRRYELARTAARVGFDPNMAWRKARTVEDYLDALAYLETDGKMTS